jgi:hypothetical protein
MVRRRTERRKRLGPGRRARRRPAGQRNSGRRVPARSAGRGVPAPGARHAIGQGRDLRSRADRRRDPLVPVLFRPVAGVLPAPDTLVGGHAIVAYGWDARGLRLRNSWGATWGIGGDCWLPARLVPRLSGAWEAVDAIEHPIAWVTRSTSQPSPASTSGGPRRPPPRWSAPPHRARRGHHAPRDSASVSWMSATSVASSIPSIAYASTSSNALHFTL